MNYKSKPTKDHGQERTKINKLNRKKQKNDMVKHAVYEIILLEKNRLSDQYEAHKIINSEIDKDDIYKIYYTILLEKKGRKK